MDTQDLLPKGICTYKEQLWTDQELTAGFRLKVLKREKSTATCCIVEPPQNTDCGRAQPVIAAQVTSPSHPDARHHFKSLFIHDLPAQRTKSCACDAQLEPAGCCQPAIETHHAFLLAKANDGGHHPAVQVWPRRETRSERVGRKMICGRDSTGKMISGPHTGRQLMNATLARPAAGALSSPRLQGA